MSEKHKCHMRCVLCCAVLPAGEMLVDVALVRDLSLHASFGAVEVPVRMRTRNGAISCLAPPAFSQDTHQVPLCLTLGDGCAVSNTVTFTYVGTSGPGPAGSAAARRSGEQQQAQGGWQTQDAPGGGAALGSGGGAGGGASSGGAPFGSWSLAGPSTTRTRNLESTTTAAEAAETAPELRFPQQLVVPASSAALAELSPSEGDEITSPSCLSLSTSSPTDHPMPMSPPEWEGRAQPVAVLLPGSQAQAGKVSCAALVGA